MTARERIALAELPPTAAREVADFLHAYRIADAGRFIVREVVPSLSTAHEREFDLSKQRFLTSAERQQQLPPPDSVVYESEDWRVTATYCLRPADEQLWVHLDVFSRTHGGKLAEHDQAVYGPLEWDIPTTVARVVARAAFPQEYASWQEQQKLGYWASALHRARRWCGEQGADEDAAFTPELLQHMRAIDPDVDARLPGILSLTAQLGQAAPEDLRRAFELRVGVAMK
jgi:hypothetical protein